MSKKVEASVTEFWAEIEGKCFLSMDYINDVINRMEAKKADYEAQREANAADGNWALVKAIKQEEFKLQRDISLIRKLLSNANS